MSNLKFKGEHSISASSETNNKGDVEVKAEINKNTLKSIEKNEKLGDETLKWWFSKWRDWIWPEWLNILEHPAKIKVAITDRSTGKSKNTGFWLLFRVMTEPDFMATLIMRNYDECLEIIRPQYLTYIDAVVNLIAPTHLKGKEREKWFIKEGDKWDSFHQAVMYAKDGRNPRERIFFITIWDAEKAKKADHPHQQIFLEECVPTKNQLKKGKGIEKDEPNNYMTIYNSVRRGTVPQQNFLGNPNMPWLDLWFLNLHWPDELELISKWYWVNTPSKHKENLKAWRKWTWSIKDIWEAVKFADGVKYNEKYNCLEKEIEGFGLASLYIKKVEHQQQPFPTDDDFSWHLFFKTAEELKYCDFVNGSYPICIFEDCILYRAKAGYFFFCHKDFEKRTNRENDENIKEYYVSREQQILSNQRIKWQVDKEKLRRDWAWKYDKGQLYFCKDGKSREIIMRFLGRGLLEHQIL